ncbi:hypothetical protein SUGI_1141300 [Cryptomeria japonica]|uniref:cyclin-dependent kinase inhibitor 5 n=1 Tax=Cryptomeria japonica TaxID=3369 RepID=UPI0024148CE9|nr:cyclin-dependent kinase inhibitor 5 [Cryptomeria japonica]GLJ53493.1 hypothetical protein SUGI_1141300 [Cryptomeria japonica]
MGKYMRKAKGAGEVAVMEVSSQSSLGVRTRARTRTLLALQNQNKKSSPTPNKPPKMCIAPATINTSSYLELRSRKLEKTTGPCCAVAAQETRLKKMGKLYCSASERSRNVRKEHLHSHSTFMVSEEQQEQPKSKASKLSSIAKQRSIHSGSRGSPSAVSNSTSFSQVCSKRKSGRAQRKEQVKKSNDDTQDIVPQSNIRAQAGQLQVFEDETPTPIEGSFGENAIDQEGRDRHIRESTPSSLIGDGETLEAPGSTTRPSCRSSGRRRLQGESRRDVPTSREMEEFFAGAEQQQQRIFIERYNYDPVNDLPLPGRYEWVAINTAGFRP